MTPSRTLQKQYGRLKVLGESTVDHRRIVEVRCACGRTKQVMADALLSGRTKSCGRGACKMYSRAEKQPGYKPKPPRAMTPAAVQRAWARYHHDNPAQRRSVSQLAQIHNVNLNTLQSIFRSVRLSGGIAAYMKAVK